MSVAVGISISIAMFLLPSVALVNSFASTTIPASGTFAGVFTSETVSNTVDGNVFISFTFSQTLTGTYTGARSGSGTMLIHPDGTFLWLDVGTFTGTIAGVQGTATISTFVRGTSSYLTAYSVTSNGAGGLAGVRGQGIATGDPTSSTTVAGTYTGIVVFSS
jgi:hypothetical protein